MALLGGNCAAMAGGSCKPLEVLIKSTLNLLANCPVLAALFLFFKLLAPEKPGTFEKHSNVSVRKLCGAFMRGSK